MNKKEATAKTAMGVSQLIIFISVAIFFVAGIWFLDGELIFKGITLLILVFVIEIQQHLRELEAKA